MEHEPEKFIEIPPKALSKEAFQALLDEFILREGTDYGHSDVTIEDKRSQVLNQIQGGHVRILFSTKTENCTLMEKSQIPPGARLEPYET